MNDSYKSNFDLEHSFSTNQLNEFGEIRKKRAARTIEKAWCSYRDVQIFKLLKHAICAAEHSLSSEIIKKICPKESNILKDPCLKPKIKFRFAGEEFPPYIVFKIYVQTLEGKTSKYINGKNLIKASSQAAKEACTQMGNKKYYNLMILDSLQNQSNKKIHDEIDIVSLKDYMQYSSLIDELPAYLGGRSNSWRRLNLTDVPRQTIFYDVINYATNGKMSEKLSREMPILLKAPLSQEILLEQINSLSKINLSTEDSNQNVSIRNLNSSNFKSSLSQVSSRRSKNALSKVSKMKKAYMMPRSETLTTDGDMLASGDRQTESFKLPDDLNDDLEDEVKNLYMWTKNLSTNDNFLNSPR